MGRDGREWVPNYWRRIDAALAEPGPGKTVRVRIACCVDAEGYWYACGCGEADDEDTSQEALDNVSDHCKRVVHWITADVPVPQAVEVEGEVCDG